METKLSLQNKYRISRLLWKICLDSRGNC